MRLHDAARFLTIAALTTGLPSYANELELLNFELEDQFNNLHRHEDVRRTIVLLIGSDGGGSQFNEVWADGINESLGEYPGYGQISHLAYADLRGVPFFLKGYARGRFPDDPGRWVLMDWKGVIAKAYDFAPKASNVLVFDRDGSLVLQASGEEPDEESIEEVVSALRALLDDQ